MDQEIEQLISVDARRLEEWAEKYPSGAERFKNRGIARPPLARNLRRRVLWSLVAVHALIVLALTWLHLQWTPSLEKRPTEQPALQAFSLNTSPAEISDRITPAFLEVAKWAE